MPTTTFPLFIYATTVNSLKLKEERLLSEVLHISSCAILSASGNDHCQNHTKYHHNFYPFSIFICYPNLYLISNQLPGSIRRCLSRFDYLPRLIFLLTFTTSAKRAATTASVITNTIIIVILSLL